MISEVCEMIICLKDNIFSILRKNHFSNFEMIMRVGETERRQRADQLLATADRW